MKALLMDGDSVLVRASRAVSGRRLEPPGEAAVALGSFLRYIREEQPDQLLVAWDDPGELWRRRVYPAYKGSRHRSGISSECHGIVTQVLRFLGISTAVFLGCEADDVIAAYCRAAAPGSQVIVVSGDRDLLQLATGNTVVRMIPYGKGGDDAWDAGRVFAERGCMPGRLPAVAALAGDYSDRIPGIPGIGPARAKVMLAKAGWDLDKVAWKTILDHANALQWLSLTDLNSSQARLHWKKVSHIPVFRPEIALTAMPDSLLRKSLKIYGLTRIEASLTAGTLWARSA
jgi:DNA polymerase-1